jgi:hypothetical protein
MRHRNSNSPTSEISGNYNWLWCKNDNTCSWNQQDPRQNLRAIHKISGALTPKLKHMLARQLILTRLDYCNSVAAICTKADRRVLQKIQNWAARLVCNIPRTTPATDSLKSLHWLPIEGSINFKVCLLAHNAYHRHSCPTYITSRLVTHTTVRSLRSASAKLLKIRLFKCNCGPRDPIQQSALYWIKLPQQLRDEINTSGFKKILKTFLFRRNYLC